MPIPATGPLECRVASGLFCRSCEVQDLWVSVSAEWFPLGTISSLSSAIPVPHCVCPAAEFRIVPSQTHSRAAVCDLGEAGPAGSRRPRQDRQVWEHRFCGSRGPVSATCLAPAHVSLCSDRFCSPPLRCPLLCSFPVPDPQDNAQCCNPVPSFTQTRVLGFLVSTPNHLYQDILLNRHSHFPR